MRTIPIELRALFALLGAVVATGCGGRALFAEDAPVDGGAGGTSAEGGGGQGAAGGQGGSGGHGGADSGWGGNGGFGGATDGGGYGGYGGTAGSGGTTGGGGWAGSGAGGSGGGGYGGTAGTCDQETQGSSTACQKCLEPLQSGLCSAETLAFSSNPEAEALIEDLGNCPDESCYNAAFAAHPDGQYDVLNWYSCMIAACASDCNCPGCALGEEGTACDACLDATCLAACDSCETSKGCTAAFLCGRWTCDGTDSSCIENCVKSFPDGTVPSMKLIGTDGCMAMSCSMECQ